MRIASLLASGTELCCALGAGDELVGRSHECDHPPWVKRLPVLSRPTFDVTGPSAAIDALVRAKLRAGAPLYEVDEAALAALAPDIVLTQSHCEVCAVGPAALDGACAPALRRERVVTLQGGTLDGILDDFRAVAALLGRAAAGEALCARLRAHREAWRARAAALPHPTVVCLEWIEPPFAMGNWGPELVALAGGDSLLGASGAHSTTTPWQAVRDADPEVLVVAPCGFDLARATAEMPTLAAYPGFTELRAARAGRVYVADGNLYFNRSGPAVFDTIDLLAELLHPGQFPRRFEGAAFTCWPAA
jgi:iron complex transport system substrate-binding protein